MLVQGNTVVVDKNSLRANYKRKVEVLGKESKDSQSSQVLAKLHTYLKNQIGIWTLFSPLNDEPNLLSLLKISSHLQWVFPKVESKTEMNFFTVGSIDEMVCSGWGVEEPPADPARIVPPQEITGCIIPGIAFDAQGTRLGRGGGYYDRFLQKFKGLKLGVTFIQGLAEETLPNESHDQKMNIVVSPDQWIEVETSEVRNGF